ncbi:MAG: ABC transporter ATP-binding protein [Candidatus Nanopelagicales bacterium]
MRYSGRAVVDGLSITAPTGAVTVVLGPNGAGKTTTLEVAEGFRRPQAGVVRVLGRDPQLAGAQLRERVGIMLQAGGAWPASTPRQVLRHLQRQYEHPQDPEELLRLVELSTVAGTAYRRLSGGEQRRLHLASALIGRPELVFLDEPTTGLDPESRLRSWELVRALRAAGVSVVMSTHLLDEAEALADQVVVIAAGRVRAAGTLAELAGAHATPALRFRAPPTLPLGQLRLDPGLRVVESAPGAYEVTGPITPHVAAVITSWCAGLGVMPTGLTTTTSLAELYFQITADPQTVPGGPR